MTILFLPAALAAWMAFCPQEAGAQDRNELPSVAEAARAARERQRPAGTSRVLTNEDLQSRGNEMESSASPASEMEARAALERELPEVLSLDTLKDYRDSFAAYTFYPASTMAVTERVSALRGYEGVRFAGRAEWERKMEMVAERLHEESTKAKERVQAILEANEAVLAKDSKTAEELRKLHALRRQVIDELLPAERWALPLQRLEKEGRAKARAHLRNSPNAHAENR